MKVTCYGSRGSIPTPSRKGFSTVEFGGNTNCFFVEAGDFKIIMGCGSGVSVLGDHLMKDWQDHGKNPQTYIVLLTHYHWDHIQGMPFCTPFFIGTNTFHIHGFKPSGQEGKQEPHNAVEMMLAHQQSNPHFPVAHEAMPARKVYVGHNRQFTESATYGPDMKVTLMGVANPNRSLDSEHLRITTIPLQHPNGCLGYHLEHEGKAVAFCYDMEPLRFPNQKVTTLTRGADLLVLDGAYTEEQLQGMQQGFGHGSPESCVEQAKDAEAKRLLIHHHDPKHDDDKLREMEASAEGYAAMAEYSGMVEFAREGNTYDL